MASGPMTSWQIDRENVETVAEFIFWWLLAIWSLVLLPFTKFSLYIWKFSVHILLKPILKDFEHYLASMWNQCCCAVVWTFFGIAFLWDWKDNWPFPLLCFIKYYIKQFIVFDAVMHKYDMRYNPPNIAEIEYIMKITFPMNEETLTSL